MLPTKTLAMAALMAAPVLPLTVTVPAAAAGAATIQTAPAAFAAAPRHSRHWWHCHTSARPCAWHHPAPHVTNARARVVRAAERYIGQPYVYGRLDCSSLTQHAYAAVGIHLPRTAAAQALKGRATSHPGPGDLVAWGHPAYHMAIYIGRGRVVAASHTGTLVHVQAIWGHPTYRALLA